MPKRDVNRLYELLPAHIRTQDHLQGSPLQALMVLLANELNGVEEDIDQLYENWFIETSEDWAVPYLGDLLGVRNLRPSGDKGGRLRAYVANTLSYRQAKGTAAILEQLTRDVTGWPAHAVEFFQRLIQNQNLNHVRLGNAGCVSLRDGQAAAKISGPFEQANHTIDVRSIAAGRGRYNIPNVGLYVWRLQSYYVGFAFERDQGYSGGVVPRKAEAIGPGFFYLDPVGRELPLFNRVLTELSISTLSTERHVPRPLDRRVLFHDLQVLQSGDDGGGVYFKDLPVIEIRLNRVSLPHEKLHCCMLDEHDDGQGGITWRRPSQQGEVMFDPVLGRLSVHEDDAAADLEVAYAYGFPGDIGGGPYDRRASIEVWMKSFDPDPASFFQTGVTKRQEEWVDPHPVDGHSIVGSLAQAITKWNDHTASVPDARGIISIMDSATYAEPLTTAERLIRIPAGAQLAIVAAGWPIKTAHDGTKTRSPGDLAAQDRRPHIASNIRVKGEPMLDKEPGTLIIDGLLIEGQIVVTPGDLGNLDIRHSTVGAQAETLGPGIAVNSGADGQNLKLSLSLDHVISGSVDAETPAGSICIVSTILGEDRDATSDPMSAPVVLNAPDADLDIQQSTIFGKLTGRTLEASDTIFTAHVKIARRQEGCIRFSYLPQGSRTPRRYRCAPDRTLLLEAEHQGPLLTAEEQAAIRARIQPRFTSSAFGSPAFGQLSLVCAAEISAGGDGGAEMGAYNSLGEPFRRANLRDALDEYLPLGLQAGIIFVS